MYLVILAESHIPKEVAFVWNKEQARQFFTDNIAKYESDKTQQSLKAKGITINVVIEETLRGMEEPYYVCNTQYCYNVMFHVHKYPLKLYGKDTYFVVERQKMYDNLLGHFHIYFNELEAVEEFIRTADNVSLEDYEVMFVWFAGEHDKRKPIKIF